jgi:replicative DNA helicase
VNNEQRLISKIIRERNIVPALQRKVNAAWFLDPDNRKVWELVVQHYSEYNEIPSEVVISDNYPNYVVLEEEKIADNVEYILDKMVALRKEMITRNGLEASVEQIRIGEYDGALIQMEKTITLVNDQGVLGTHELDLSKDTDERYQEYLKLQNEEFLGIPTGFEKIDEATAGLQGGQLITIIAPPKTGKSQIALKMAINVHEQGKVPMFQSFEMNNKEQQQRHDSIRAHISHTRLRRGKLTTAEDKRFTDMLDRMDKMQSFHLVDAVNGLTVSALSAKIQQTNPDVVFVDGVYLMLDEVSGEMNTPQAITNITRALKRLAQRIDKPVIITTQTLLWKMRGGKVTADSIGYSSSFFQDSDVILGLEQVEEDEEVRKLRVVASRNCPPTETSITWLWETGCFHDESETTKCNYCTTWMLNRP